MGKLEIRQKGNQPSNPPKLKRRRSLHAFSLLLRFEERKRNRQAKRAMKTRRMQEAIHKSHFRRTPSSMVVGCWSGSMLSKRMAYLQNSCKFASRRCARLGTRKGETRLEQLRVRKGREDCEGRYQTEKKKHGLSEGLRIVRILSG